MVTWTDAWCLSFHAKQLQSSSTFQNEEPLCRKTEFLFCRNKSTPHVNQTSIRGRNPQSMCGTVCPGILLFVSVCVACSCCLVWWMKLWGVCLSPSPLLWLLSALAQSRWGIHVTLTGIKQDTALRQRQMWAGMSYFSIMPAAFFLLVATLPRPPSISLSVSLPALSQESVKKTEIRAVLPPRGWFVHSTGCGVNRWLWCSISVQILMYQPSFCWPQPLPMNRL